MLWLFLAIIWLSVEQIETYRKLEHGTPIFSCFSLVVGIVGWLIMIIKNFGG